MARKACRLSFSCGRDIEFGPHWMKMFALPV